MESIIIVMFAPVFVYWVATFVAASLLPRERRALEDARKIPSLFSPLESHRWLGLLFAEDTKRFSSAARWSFRIAKISFLLIPVAFLVALVMAGHS